MTPKSFFASRSAARDGRRASRSALRRSLELRLANFIARRALSSERVEQAIVRLCRAPHARELLRVGAVAMAYPRVLRAPALRTADLGRYRMRVNVREHLGLGPYFFGDTGTLWVAQRIVRLGDACIDAGANTGHYTLFFASRVGPTGSVHAFEPNPTYASLLDESIRINGFGAFTRVIRRALWSVPDERMTFFLSTDPRNSGVSSLVDHGHSLAKEHTIEVETTTLDTFADGAGLKKIRLVKIDVERAESHVLRGMSKLLSRGAIDYVILEMTTGEDLEAFIAGHGYSCHLIDPSKRRLVPLEQVPSGSFGDFLLASPAAAGTIFDLESPPSSSRRAS